MLAGLESEVVLWLLGPPGTGVEVRDFCQAALCEGARLTSQQFQHLMILLAAWYHCDVYLCEAGSSIGRLATVKASLCVPVSRHHFDSSFQHCLKYTAQFHNGHDEACWLACVLFQFR